ncbi:MAG: hypothetical protein HY069_01755 [Chlamydiia bacterium]|nr:hypothetical protein [Chlamydiia bacterium]
MSIISAITEAAQSQPAVQAAEQESIQLKGKALHRFNQFFATGRSYQLNNQPLILTQFLQKATRELEQSGIEVRGVYLKGGAARNLLSDSPRPIPDIDLVIEIQRPYHWGAVELAIQNATGFSPIHSPHNL